MNDEDFKKIKEDVLKSEIDTSSFIDEVLLDATVRLKILYDFNKPDFYIKFSSLIASFFLANGDTIDKAIEEYKLLDKMIIQSFKEVDKFLIKGDK